MAAMASSCVMPAVRASGLPARRSAGKSAPAKSRASVRAKAVEAPANLERLRITTPWEDAQVTLKEAFGMTEAEIAAAGDLSDEDLTEAYTTMQLCRQFENACNQAYMQGNIRGFMHLDNGQETIPALIADTIKKGDIKYSYYREHTHAIASGVEPGPVMAELFAKDTGTCRGTGGSMHIYDVDTHFQGGWALVSEQLPYAVGAARSIVLDKHLGTGEAKIASPSSLSAVTRKAAAWRSASTPPPRRTSPSSSSSSTTAAPSTPSPRTSRRTRRIQPGQALRHPGVLAGGQNVQDTVRIGRAIQHVRTGARDLRCTPSASTAAPPPTPSTSVTARTRSDGRARRRPHRIFEGPRMRASISPGAPPPRRRRCARRSSSRTRPPRPHPRGRTRVPRSHRRGGLPALSPRWVSPRLRGDGGGSRGDAHRA